MTRMRSRSWSCSTAPACTARCGASESRGRGRRGRAGGVPGRVARTRAIRGKRAVLHMAVPDRTQRGASVQRRVASPRRGRSRSRDPIAALLGRWSSVLRPRPSPRVRAGPRPKRSGSYPTQWRDAVVLRDIEGLSTEEAAEIIGVRQAAFKSRLHRGRMRLRALLEPYVGLGEG